MTQKIVFVRVYKDNFDKPTRFIPLKCYMYKGVAYHNGGLWYAIEPVTGTVYLTGKTRKDCIAKVEEHRDDYEQFKQSSTYKTYLKEKQEWIVQGSK